MNSPTLIRFCPTESGSRNILTQGKDFYFDPFRFERHLIAAIDPLAVDLLRVALGVYVLDRVTRRKNRSPWSSAPRDMVIDIQVCRPEFWREPHIRRLIEEVLRFLSSDLWQVSFSQLARQPEPRQDALQYPEAKPVVCLYSGGLDSAAGLATWLRDNSEPVLAVCVLHQSAQKPLCDDHIRRLRNHYQRDLNLIPIRAQLMSAGRALITIPPTSFSPEVTDPLQNTALCTQNRIDRLVLGGFMIPARWPLGLSGENPALPVFSLYCGGDRHRDCKTCLSRPHV